MAISNLVLTQQIYSEETNGAHAHYREPVPLSVGSLFSMEEVFILNALYHCHLYFYPAFINNVTDCFRYHHHHTLSLRNYTIDYRSSTGDNQK